jgi:hypothetical protein
MIENDIVTAAPKRSRRGMYLASGLGAFLLLVCVCLAGIGGVLIVDPFDLYVFERLTGRYDAALVAVPATSTAYASLNLVNAQGEDLDQIIAAFAQATEEGNVQTAGDAIDKIDEMLEEEIGLTFSDDVQPWIGQYVGFSLGQITLDEFGQPENVEWLVAAESRDNEAADRFLEQIRTQAMAERVSITTETAGDITLYVRVTDNPLEEVAFARSGNLVLVASGSDQLRAAIDAQDEGLSLAESDVYQDLARKLPRNRLLTFYVSGQQLQDLTAAFSQGVSVLGSDVATTSFAETVISLSAVESGIRMDTVTRYDPEILTEAQRLLLEANDQERETATIMPANSLFYLSGPDLAQSWAVIRERAITSMGQAAFDESMESAVPTVGFNPDTELMPLLDGEWALTVMPGENYLLDGLQPSDAELNLGIIVLAGTSQQAAMLDTLDKMSSTLQEQAFIIEKSESAGTTLYLVDAGFAEEPQLAFGLDQAGYLFITTNADGTPLVSDGSGLAGSTRYQEVWTAFPADTRPAFFLDMQGLFGTVREGMDELGRESFDESVRPFSPITYIAAGNLPAEGDIRQGTMIIFVETNASEETTSAGD